MATSIAENVAAIAQMSAQELRSLNVNEKAYVYDVIRADSAIMRFGDTVLLIPQQELDVTCCRSCAFRCESACLMHLREDEVRYVEEYVAAAIQGDPMYGFLETDPDDPNAEPLRYMKMRLMPFHETYPEDGENDDNDKPDVYGAVPLPLPLLRLAEPCAPHCMFTSMLLQQFHLIVQVQGDGSTRVSNDAHVTKTILRRLLRSNQPLCDLLLSIVTNRCAAAD